MSWWAILLIIVGSVVILGGIALWVVCRVRRKSRDDHYYVKRHRHGKWTF